MMLRKLAAFFAIPLIAAQQLAAGPLLPDETQMATIKEAVAARMLDPESTILSDVLLYEKAVGDEKLVWVCGHARGKNSFGGYAQPVPFLGALVTPKAGPETFMLIKLSGSSPAEKANVLAACVERMKD